MSKFWLLSVLIRDSVYVRCWTPRPKVLGPRLTGSGMDLYDCFIYAF
jgi:hypothetical protein